MDKYSSPARGRTVVNPDGSFVKVKEVPEGPSSLEEDLHLSLHDSLDSDSESLIQERMYQFELQRRIHENEELVNKTPSEEQDDTDNEEDNKLHDSLEESSNSDESGRIAVKLEHTKSVLQKDSASKQHSLDKYAGLQYDPNWRNTKEGRGGFPQETSPHFQDSLEDSFQDSSDLSDEDEAHVWEEDNSYMKEQSMGSKTAQVVGFPVRENRKDSEDVDKLEPSSSPLYPNKERKAVNRASYHSVSKPQFKFPVSSDQQYKIIDDHSKNREKISRRTPVTHQLPTAHEINDCTPEKYSVGAEKKSKDYQAELSSSRSNTDSVGSNEQLPINYTKTSNRKPNKNTKSNEDIIERNKLTLGVNTFKHSSYLNLHSRKKEVSENQVSVPTADDEEPIQRPLEEQEMNLDPEERWQQRAQRLKTQKHKTLQPDRKRNSQVTQGHRELLNTQHSSGRIEQKMHYKENNSLNSVKLSSHQRNPRAAEGLAIERGDHATHFMSSGETSVISSRSSPSVYSMHSLPTVNLNINVNTSSEFIPSVNHDHNQATINLISSQRPLQQTPSALKNYNILNSPKVQLGMQSGDYRYNPETIPYQHSSLFYGYPGSSPSVDRHIQNHHFRSQLPGELQPQQVMYYNESKAKVNDPSHCHERQLESKQHKKNHVNTGLPPMPHSLFHNVNLVHPTTTQPAQQIQYPYQEAPWLRLSPYSYTVFPPIVQRVDSDSEVYTGGEEKEKTMMHRSNSESYLTQLQKQKQLKEKPVYKPYTLNDYKNVKQEVKLGGLGPDYHSVKEKIEKLKQQKDYAKLIREQNKKKSTSPLSPQAKPSVSSESKRALPRQKALEYAKKIPKPKPLVKAGSTNLEPGAERYQKSPGYIEEMDLSQFTMLGMLQQRHEQEKEAVAAFKALHVS